MSLDVPSATDYWLSSDGRWYPPENHPDPSKRPGWWCASDGEWYPPENHPDPSKRPGWWRASDGEWYAADSPPTPADDAATLAHGEVSGPPATPRSASLTSWKRPSGHRRWVVAIAAIAVVAVLVAMLSGHKHPTNTATDTVPADSITLSAPATNQDLTLWLVRTSNARSPADFNEFYEPAIRFYATDTTNLSTNHLLTPNALDEQLIALSVGRLTDSPQAVPEAKMICHIWRTKGPRAVVDEVAHDYATRKIAFVSLETEAEFTQVAARLLCPAVALADPLR
jgi:hypothetical protein